MDKHGEGTYLEVKMPERFLLQFQLKDGSWMDEAICLRRRFERLDNGSYICSEFSSGLWIRCIADHGDHFDHVDGGGKVHRYRLVPLPMRVRTSAVRTRLRGPGRASRGFVDISEECDSYPSCGDQGRASESFGVQTALQTS